MFSWLFSKSNQARSVTLFEDPYSVIECEQNLSPKNRVELDRCGCIQLCSNVNEASNWLHYYEVIYIKEGVFRFIVFHSMSKRLSQEIYHSAKVSINILDHWFALDKNVVSEQLKSIMECLRINPNWTCAHIAARLGTFDSYFMEHLPPEVVNAQVEPEMYTPLHVAIKQHNLPTVRLLLNLAPNLNLVNFKKHSVLHYAAVSTQEIAALILSQEGMFERILWQDGKGCTALHLACFIMKYDIVFEFLKFGLTVRMLTLSPPNSRRQSSTNLARDSSPRMQVVVHFTEQDFDDIDCQDIYCAGTPLHWSKHKRLIDKLLKYSFPLNARNCNGDSALHVVAKRLRLKCVISLLCAGSNVNSVNIFGNTPLHLAVKENDLVVPQTLIVFDADINAKNYINESVRHVAAKSCKSVNNEAILYLLSALGAKRCPSKPTATENSPELVCTNGCSATGDFEGNISEKMCGVDQRYDQLFKDFLFGDFLARKEARTTEQIEKEKGVNLLCLDGGGIKGLISLQMLKEVEKLLKHPLNAYFKWYAGTSTGSFICAFLAMGKSIDEIRATYFKFKDQVLTGEKPYSSESLEAVLREAVGADIKMEDILSKFGKYLVIPTVVANRRPMKLHHFRSFPGAQELLEESGKPQLLKQLLPDRDAELKNCIKYKSRKMEVWKACRASGAAPIYFRAYGNFLDGGLIANNPTMDVIAEFEHYNAALRAVGKSSQCQNLDLVLSIGTGRSLLEESDMVDIDRIYSLSSIQKYLNLIVKLVYEACQTEQHVSERAEAFCISAKVPYFRINAFLSEMMELDEQQDYKIVNCLWETKRFMYYRRSQVRKLVRYLEKTYIPPLVPSKLSRQSKEKMQRSSGSNTSLRRTRSSKQSTTNRKKTTSKESQKKK